MLSMKGVYHMQYRNLGSTNMKVSTIGFGGIPIQRKSQEDAKSLVQAALDQGINFFDTARGYTDSEEKIGYSLKGQREKAIIATKSMARSKEAILKDVAKSLADLQTDYIDLYQLHNVKDEGSLAQVLGQEGALEGLKELKAQGKIKHIGITGHIPSILVKAIKTKEFSTVQFPFNAIEKGALEELFPLAQELNLGTIIMKPLGGGAIQNAHKALNYILQYPVTTIIPGMESLEQVQVNVGVGRSPQPLTVEEMEEFHQELRELGEAFCRRCEYCLPCPQGIDIPTVFLLEGYYDRYGLPQWAIERYSGMAVKASACSECGNCQARCPYELQIIGRLKNVKSKLEGK